MTQEKLFSHCTATRKCWEHYGSHWATVQPVAWVLELAAQAVGFRARMFVLDASDANCERLNMAAWRFHALTNRRWCNLHREPFAEMRRELAAQNREARTNVSSLGSIDAEDLGL